MGRKPTVNLALPPRMRKRIRGKNTYYFYDTGAKPRKEIALGSDFIVALRKYADLHKIDPPKRLITFGDVVARYRAESLPKLAASTIATQTSDMKHVEAYFATAPLDEIKPSHISKFLAKHSDKPTTANRGKRLFSTMWNQARGWGYTDLPNPCEGIKGHALAARTVYITDDVFHAVHAQGDAPLRDALDLAYLTGQRPGDTLDMTELDLVDGHLIVTQFKTTKPLRITLTGRLAETIARIHARKALCKTPSDALLVTDTGKRVTKQMLRKRFEHARAAAAKKAESDGQPLLAARIKEMWFYDLRAKAADDTREDRGEQAASDLLGHDSVRTTQKHYLRRGKVVAPTK
ncbi:tyrosine-type recombinase/integrase [Massilia antarctica]|uniref:tyrosine-type recombinase/integrase n=1 Tax=Massilia antarctica TaxID=2765360 RepID=UPI0022704B39|nr:tyrosine-type recombinase/integrase [Massilia sp. H27-R4]MCY0910916.1 tyrosine-type recombinase/integrase [Massilia sp. H27-R4]